MIILLPIIQELKNFTEKLFSPTVIAALIGLLGIWLNRLYETRKARRELLKEKAAKAQSILSYLFTSDVLNSKMLFCNDLIKGDNVNLEILEDFYQNDLEQLLELSLIFRQYFRKELDNYIKFHNELCELHTDLNKILLCEHKFDLPEKSQELLNTKFELINYLSSKLINYLDQYFYESKLSKLTNLFHKIKGKLWKKQPQ